MNENGENTRNSKQDLKKQVEVDWDGIRNRIAAAAAALERSDEIAPAAMERVWAHRAKRLAQVPAKPDEGEQIQLVLLRLGREVYGLGVQYVFDIRLIEPRSITRVPRAPSWVAGVVNLRGRILSVVDLQRFLGLSPAEDADDSAPTRCLVVVETSEMELALLADEVLPMETVSAGRIQDAAGTFRGIRPEYVRGIADRSSGGSMVILNLPALLTDKQLIIHEEIV
jgi:purine-binding chemotaxis protein CheW